jgi:hypothetical protein
MDESVESDQPVSDLWRPTAFVRHEESLDSSMATVRIVTDAGPAYIKALGNRQGPHALACEWVATHLAQWLRLATFDYAIIEIDAIIDEIPFFRGGMPLPGLRLSRVRSRGTPGVGQPKNWIVSLTCGMWANLLYLTLGVRNCDRHPADLTVRRPNLDNVFLEDVSPSVGGRSAGSPGSRRIRHPASRVRCPDNSAKDRARMLARSTVRQPSLTETRPMKPKRGYYSLIQFCPSPSRLETVNVGLVLLCPEANFIGVRTANDNRAAQRLVGHGRLDKPALNSAKRAIEQRFQADRDSFKSPEDLQAFANTRGNILKLTSPRPVKVFDPSAELDGLFAELVGGRSMRQRGAPLSPQLDDVFQSLQKEGRAQLNLTVEVPVVGRSLRIPYAYQNGRLNLVKPQRFSNEENLATETAMRLAIEGDLLQRHTQPGETERKLIVVSFFTQNDRNGTIAARVSKLLGEYEVKTIGDDEISQFASQVVREAHRAENTQ